MSAVHTFISIPSKDSAYPLRDVCDAEGSVSCGRNHFGDVLRVEAMIQERGLHATVDSVVSEIAYA